MYKYQNKKATYEGKLYEIFWVTDFAQHIMNRKEHHSHKIDFMEVEKYAEKAEFIKIGREWQGLFRHNSGNLLELCKELNI